MGRRLPGLVPGPSHPYDRLGKMRLLDARLESVREWPFDAPSLVRFALYVALGLGSWLGAAAVERLLDFILN